MDSKPCSYPSTSGDQRTITTISDFYSQRQWHETGMYRECVPYVEHEAMMCLSAPPGRSRRLLLIRSGNRDFDDRDRLILTLLRPHLDEAYQHLQQARWYGFSFASSNGFTSDVQERWDNNSSQTVYVCGDRSPVQDSQIFWNT